MICASECRCLQRPEVTDGLELELQAVVSHMIWVLWQSSVLLTQRHLSPGPLQFPSYWWWGCGVGVPSICVLFSLNDE